MTEESGEKKAAKVTKNDAAAMLLLLGLVSLAATLCTLIPARRLGFGVALYFLVSWLQGELALIHMLWQGLLALYLVGNGGLDSGWGVLGLLALMASFAGLVVVIRQSRASEDTYRQALAQQRVSDAQVREFSDTPRRR